MQRLVSSGQDDAVPGTKQPPMMLSHRHQAPVRLVSAGEHSNLLQAQAEPLTMAQRVLLSHQFRPPVPGLMPRSMLLPEGR